MNLLLKHLFSAFSFPPIELGIFLGTSTQLYRNLLSHMLEIHFQLCCLCPLKRSLITSHHFYLSECFRLVLAFAKRWAVRADPESVTSPVITLCVTGAVAQFRCYHRRHFPFSVGSSVIPRNECITLSLTFYCNIVS